MISIYNLYTKKSNLKSEIYEWRNGKRRNCKFACVWEADVSNGDMRPRRAPGMPKIKHVKNHAPGTFHYQTMSQSIFSFK